MQACGYICIYPFITLFLHRGIYPSHHHLTQHHHGRTRQKEKQLDCRLVRKRQTGTQKYKNTHRPYNSGRLHDCPAVKKISSAGSRHHGTRGKGSITYIGLTRRFTVTERACIASAQPQTRHQLAPAGGIKNNQLGIALRRIKDCECTDNRGRTFRIGSKPSHSPPTKSTGSIHTNTSALLPYVSSAIIDTISLPDSCAQHPEAQAFNTLLDPSSNNPVWTAPPSAVSLPPHTPPSKTHANV